MNGLSPRTFGPRLMLSAAGDFLLFNAALALSFHLRVAEPLSRGPFAVFAPLFALWLVVFYALGLYMNAISKADTTFNGTVVGGEAVQQSLDALGEVHGWSHAQPVVKSSSRVGGVDARTSATSRAAKRSARCSVNRVSAPTLAR